MVPFARSLAPAAAFAEHEPAAAFEIRAPSQRNVDFDEDAVASLPVYWPCEPPCSEEEECVDPLHSNKAARFCLGQAVIYVPSKKRQKSS
jgi:hypothetical protein